MRVLLFHVLHGRLSVCVTFLSHRGSSRCVYNIVISRYGRVRNISLVPCPPYDGPLHSSRNMLQQNFATYKELLWLTAAILIRMLYRTESLYQQRHPVTAALFRNTVNETPCSNVISEKWIAKKMNNQAAEI